MNWRFWERNNGGRELPVVGSQPTAEEEEHTMGLYLHRDETPQQAFERTVGQTQEDEARWAAYQSEAGEPEPDLPPDPLAGAAPEIQQAFESRLAQERATTRQQLARYGMDLTVDGGVALKDLQRARDIFGSQAPAPQASAAPPPPREREPAVPVPDLDDPEDAEIPDPQYDPRGYRQWQDRRTEHRVASVVNQALGPVMEALQQLGQGTTQMYVEQAVQGVEGAVEQYAPWMVSLLDHPQFETTFRQALQNIPRQNWQTPRDLAAVVGMVAPYLPPMEAAAPAPRAPRGAARRDNRQGQYDEFYGQDRFADRELDQQPVSGPVRGAADGQPGAQRDRSGRFVGRATRAAVNQAAAAAAAPSRSAGRPPVNEQYDAFILDAASRMGIPPEEARALMQDSNGDASQELRHKRLSQLR